MQKQFPLTLLGIVCLAGGIAGCNSVIEIEQIKPTQQPTVTRSPESSAPKTSPSNSISALEKAIFDQVNQYRKSQNLSALTLDSRISAQAKLHSEAMANGKVDFGHGGFEDRVKAIAKSIPYRSASENVAFNQGYSDPATKAVDGWLKSPGHLKNIQGNFDLTGIAVVKNAQNEYYFTQIFIRRSRYGF
ncbi:MAG TPA: CAP domain-containing protein [Leptolyngbyaceae cyanobacterium]